MATLISSPHIPAHAHLSRPHTPLNLSPGPSPSLGPLKPSSGAGALPTSISSPLPQAPLASASASPISPRSYARAPEQRPYQTTMVSRTLGRVVREAEGDTKRFAELVAELVVARTRALRRGLAKTREEDGGSGMAVRQSKSVGGSLAGSWENERAELIVDVPVWSPGCYQDLSTLHSLRDRTLAHTHSLLAHLSTAHSIPASYRLLARSGAGPCSPSHMRGQLHKNTGWGCIRLAPSVVSPSIGSRLELRPKVRRASMDFSDSAPVSASTSPRRQSHMPFNLHRRKESVKEEAEMEHHEDVDVRFDEAVLLQPAATVEAVALAVGVAVAASPAAEEDEDEIQLKEGYISGTVSDEEDEDADEVVLREIERRGAKEGTAFLMTLFGGPALILV